MIAADAGADYFGMVFVPGRRRRVEVKQARDIADTLKAVRSRAPLSVGLFGDQPLEDVLDTIEAARLDAVQLCGEESTEFCEAVLQRARVIKVLHVPADPVAGTVEAVGHEIDVYDAIGCIVTLDSQVAGLHGGTGLSFDWSVARRLAASGRRFLLAGGLTPDNVASAVAEANPWGVDVSSGVETDGAQDADKIRQFVANARRGE